MGGVFSNMTVEEPVSEEDVVESRRRRRPDAGSGDGDGDAGIFSGMFDSAVYPGGTPSTVMVKLALYAGSSKHGKASRAAVASNWVPARRARRRRFEPS